MFSDWSNALDCIRTLESFGTIALHDNSLHEFLNNAEIYYDAVTLTSNQSCIGKAMSTKFSYLPIHSIEEKKFSTLCLQN